MCWQAASSPPATGPLLFATNVASSLTNKQVMPYHREDGTQTVDEARLVLEDAASKKLWAVRSSSGGWQLPRWEISPTEAMVSTTTTAWDASNVIGDVQALALEDLSVQLAWLVRF